MTISNTKFSRHLERASQVVRHWPSWKRGIISGTLQSTAPRTCFGCGNKTEHNETYDVYFCAMCDVYTEDKCSDHLCQFCRNRPERPAVM